MLWSLIYHSTVRNVRRSHRNPLMGLLITMSQSIIMLVAFYLMMDILGMRSNAIRGDFVLFLLTGIFLFMAHNKAVGAVMGAEGPTSPMMKHATMNTVVSIAAAALAALYTQILSMAVILFAVHVAWHPVEIYDPPGLILPVVMAWFSGVAIGLVLMALKPWAPGLTGIIANIYRRANMICSGKMFVANNLGWKVHLFSWNPLFHVIDQARGAAFINYNPHFTTIWYPIWLSLALLAIGMMGEFYTRKHASLSWGAGK
ncbi:MAG: ABC transporter permease [Alphaproteobacteria bacterium]|nr:MAG: ABC transporter permease [Alphaproteobacteria bacterium]